MQDTSKKRRHSSTPPIKQDTREPEKMEDDNLREWESHEGQDELIQAMCFNEDPKFMNDNVNSMSNPQKERINKQSDLEFNLEFEFGPYKELISKHIFKTIKNKNY
jgi:hypothetical protein